MKDLLKENCSEYNDIIYIPFLNAINNAAKDFFPNYNFIFTKSRRREHITYRQILHYICSNDYNIPVNTVARYFNVSHGTILNSCKRVNNYLDTEKGFRDKHYLPLVKLCIKHISEIQITNEKNEKNIILKKIEKY